MIRLLLLFAAIRALAATAPYIDLSGEWRKSPDDRAEYARPDLDDRGWQTVRLPWTRNESPVELDEVYWLRRTVELPPDTGRSGLALTIGPVREVYELYVNGARVFATGPFFENAEAQIARTRIFPLTESQMGDGPRISIALRTRGARFGSVSGQVRIRGSYLLSEAARAPRYEAQAMTDRAKVTYASQGILGALLLGLASLMFVLWLAERERSDLFWLAVLTGARGAVEAALFNFISLGAFPLGKYRWVFTVMFDLGLVALIELALSTFRWRSLRLRIPFWIMVAATEYSGVYGLTSFCSDSAAIAILAAGWWRGGRLRQPAVRSATCLLIALLALAQMRSQTGLVFDPLNPKPIPTFYAIGEYRVSTLSTIFVALAASLALLALRRLITDRVERQRLSSELDAARAVQQMLLESEAPAAGAWSIETRYLPAQEVGGDFYQILEAADGGRIVLVGDVSGKGLKAAMIVSAAIGMLRQEKSASPARILAALNQGLAGHTGGGFVTCCCARFDPAGAVTVANAGHLAPYCDGREVEVEPGLPLAVALDVTYAESAVQGAAFTFLSDGVVEATNGEGELFGFHRSAEIAGKPAATIAEAARIWGQTDDITVVTVRRNG
ncbi:MAG TPA: SpoIIE family protein phosphatase [Verrucomicrobiae bacterium]|nr:SpoIIE family protein phosphatase [Verrucomicrobiae bacterium]